MRDTFDNGNTTPLANESRWSPIRKGDVYCSPACGHKCKFKDFERANAGAAALIAELGDGWQPRVWENGGWYFAADKGAATVDYSEREGHFTATIDAGHFGARRQQFRAEGNSPRAAMEAAIAEIDSMITSLKRTASSAALEPLKIEAHNSSS